MIKKLRTDRFPVNQIETICSFIMQKWYSRRGLQEKKYMAMKEIVLVYIH